MTLINSVDSIDSIDSVDSTNLIDVSPFFDAIYDIENKNRGGCLFFCYAFWKWLKKNGHSTESFQIVQYDYDKTPIMQNIQWINTNKGNPVSSNHFAWIYQGVEYDSEGIIKHKKNYLREILYGLNSPKLNVDLVEQFCVKALTKSCWNDEFDRKGVIDDLVYSLGVNLYNVDDGRY
jgi:hypothetical protein